MLTSEQICRLQERKDYKRTKRLFYNLRYSTQVVKAPGFSVTTSMVYKGQVGVSISIPIRILYWFFKLLIIAAEIGTCRSIFIETILNENTAPTFDILALIPEGGRWIEKKDEKLMALKGFIISYLIDPRIQVIIYKAAKIQNSQARIQLINEAVERTELLLNSAIYNLKKEKAIRSKTDYLTFLYTHESLAGVSKAFTEGNLYVVTDQEDKNND